MASFFSLVTELETLLGQLNTILAGADDETVQVNGVTKDSISKVIKDRFAAIQAMVQGRLNYETKADLDAAGAPPSDELAEVWNDSDLNNGLYGYTNGAWKKSGYDSISRLVKIEKYISWLSDENTSVNTIKNGNLTQSGENTKFSALSEIADLSGMPELDKLGIKFGAKPSGIIGSYQYLHYLKPENSGQYFAVSYIVFSDEDGEHHFPADDRIFGVYVRDADNNYHNVTGLGWQLDSKVDLLSSRLKRVSLCFKIPSNVNLIESLSCYLMVGYGNNPNTSILGLTGLFCASSDKEIAIYSIPEIAWDDSANYTPPITTKKGKENLLLDIQDSLVNVNQTLSKLSLPREQFEGGKDLIYENAIRNRFEGPFSQIGNHRFSTTVLNRVKDEDSLIQFGSPNVITASCPGEEGRYNCTIAFHVTLSDLAKIGIIPDDENPPKFSVSATVVKSLCTGMVTDSIQLWTALHYSDTPPDNNYDVNRQVILPNDNGNASYKGAGDNLFDHVANKYSDDKFLGWTQEGISLPKTYSSAGGVGSGDKLSGIVIILLGYWDDISDLQKLATTNISLVSGDKVNYFGSKWHVDDIKRPKITSFDPLNVDRITGVGDSFTQSTFTPKGKAWLNILSEYSDYNFENFGRSGDDSNEMALRVIESDPSNYHEFMSFKDYPTKFALLLSHENDTFARRVDYRYYADNMEFLGKTVQAHGAEPILCTEWRAVNWTTNLQIQEICDKNDWQFFNIADLNRHFDLNRYLPFWGSGHPGVRTNAIFWRNLLDHIQSLPKPEKSIKIFRPRTGDFPISSQEDLAFDNIEQRVQRWKEINIGQHALKENAVTYYDSLDELPSSYADWYHSEYLNLASGKPLVFDDWLCIQIIIPGTSDSFDRIDIDWNLTPSRNFIVYGMEYNEIPEHYRSECEEYLGLSGSPQVGDLYNDGRATRTVVEVSGNKAYMTPYSRDGQTVAGTLTKVSGSGASSISYDEANLGFTTGYQEQIGKAKGRFTRIPSQSSRGISLIGDELKHYVNGDKIVLFIRDYSSQDEVELSELEVHCYGIGGKPEKLGSKKLDCSVGKNELLDNTLFDENLTGWVIKGDVNAHIPSDNVLPTGTNKVVEVDFDNFIESALTSPADPLFSTHLDIIVWARVYPEIFNKDGNPNDAPIRTETWDEEYLVLSMADDDTESLIESTELSKVVGLHWHQVKYRINISNRGDNYSPNAEKIKMRLFSKGKKIQLARVFVRVL